MDKITMIGVSGAGKTCFIYAMYNFMSIPHNGFSFTAADLDVDLDLQNGWEQIAFDHQWPAATNITTAYDFHVQYNTHSILQFSWCDYRGGATSDRSTNQDKQDLIDRIHQSSCLIISIGADTIKEILAGNQSKARELRILNSIIHNYEINNTRRIPIIFALTKADLYTRDDQGKLIDLIKLYFQNVFLPNSGWLAAVVPITLGSFPSGNNTGAIEGMIEPKNIQVPVMFFVSSVLHEKADVIKNKLQQINNDRNNYQIKANNARDQGWLSKIWNGDISKTANANISRLDEEERNILNSLAEIERTLASMRDLFKVCKIYYEGDEIQY